MAKKLVFGALNNKKHVITANKALISKYGDKLAHLAEVNKVNLEYEASVAGGIPTLTIFGRPWAAIWTPPKVDLHSTLEHDPGCKNNCTFPECKLECLYCVTIKAVQAELEMMIRKYC